MLTNAGDKVEFKVGVDEQIQILPIEDIISIKVSTEVKKAIEQEVIKRKKHKPTEELSGCQKVKKGCMKNIFCCCDKEVLEMPDYETRTDQKQGATRVITVTIEHLRHGLVDTPSNVRVLSKEEQAKFYQKHVHVDTLKFYYLHNINFDKAEYEMQLQDSETLARIVMQLKAMVNHYPDETQLQKIIQQNFSHYFGQKMTEDIPILEGRAEVTTTTIRENTQLQLTSS